MGLQHVIRFVVLCTIAVLSWCLCERKFIATSAKCTDGTRPAYYFRKGHESGSKSWHIHFQGGGWCADIESCITRIDSKFGSSEWDRQSTQQPSSCDDFRGKLLESTEYITSDPRRNHMMHNWNTVFVAYCDGGSYAGDAVVEHNGKMLHFEGLDIRRNLIHTLLEREGMEFGAEVLISGCSAGALGVYIGLDDMADIIHTHRRQMHPQLGPVIVRGMADSGFFLDFHRSNFPSLDLVPDLNKRSGFYPTPRNVEYYEAYRMTFELMNMTAGISPACLAYVRKVGRPAHFCMFPEFAVPFLRTPIFSKQTQFDSWQSTNILRSAQPDAMNFYGKLLSQTMLTSLIHHNSDNIDYSVAMRVAEKHGGTGKFPPHALYVDSCLSHCTACQSTPRGKNAAIWTGTMLRDRTHSAGLNPYEALVEWFENTLVVQGSAQEVGHAHNQHQHRKFHTYQHTPSHRIYMQDSAYPCSDCCQDLSDIWL